MKTRIAVFGSVALITTSSLWATYTYYFSDSLTSINTTNWTQNGSLTAGSSGLTSSASGALISKVAIPNGETIYEIRTTLGLTTNGGNFYSYIRASSDALAGTSGTFYASQISNPTFSGNACTATASLIKSVSGVITILSSTTIPCHNNMEVRTLETVYAGLMLYIDGRLYVDYWDTAITTGSPAIGVSSAPAGNTILHVDLGPITHVAPTFNVQRITSSTFPNRVDLQWSGAVTPDPNGTGINFYWIGRNGVGLAYMMNDYSRQLWTFSDASVSPGTTYIYTMQVFDYDWNYTQISFNVTTPPAGAIDPRSVGVRPLGTYWGYGGEQLDMRSGNLSYSVPLLRAMGRGGLGVNLNLPPGLRQTVKTQFAVR